MIYSSVVKGTVQPPDVNASSRLALRIRRRLELLGMTGREFGQRLGHGDTWVSGLLANKFSLSLAELDQVASILRIAPGELVRESEEGWDLAPTEQRIIRACRQLPGVVRDQLASLADYLVGVTPDEVDLLHDIRLLNAQEMERLQHYVRVVRLTQGNARGTAALQGPPKTSSTPTATTPRARKQQKA